MGSVSFRLSGWRERFRSAHPDHLRIARGAARVSLFVIAGKCAGALKEMAIAYKYGISNVVDVYQLTSTIAMWLPGTLLTVLSVVLVPVFVNLRHAPREEQVQLTGELEAAGLIAGLFFTVLLYLAWPAVLSATGANMSAPTRLMFRQLAFGIAPVGVLLLAAGIYGARLQARERHINTLLEGLPAASILIFVLIWPTAHSVAPLIWGTAVGTGVQAIWLRTLANRADGVPFRFRLSFKARGWRDIWLSVRVLMIGQLASCLTLPLDQYFMTRLGNGANSTLGYAYRVLFLLLGIGALAIARATLPIFADILKQGDLARARRTALVWALVAFAAGALFIGVSWPLAPRVIGLLFERGAFTSVDTVRVAAVFRWGLLQLPFYFAMLALLQLQASERRFLLMTQISVISFVVKVVANIVLVPGLGVAGVQISTALMYASAVLMSVLMLYRSGVEQPSDAATDMSRRN